MTSYPLAVIRTQQQAQGIVYSIPGLTQVKHKTEYLLIVLFFQLSAHVQPQAFYKHSLGYMKDVALEDIITAWEQALSEPFPVL